MACQPQAGLKDNGRLARNDDRCGRSGIHEHFDLHAAGPLEVMPLRAGKMRAA